MTESYVKRPAGLSGPRTRASRKTIGTNVVKESHFIRSVPWRVDRSYRWSSANDWPPTVDAPTNVTNYPWIFGLPSGSAAGTAIVLKRLLVAAATNGSAANNTKIYLENINLPVGGTIVSAPGLKDQTGFAASSSEMRRNCTATVTGFHFGTAFLPTVASQWSPLTVFDRDWRRENWTDMIVLRPGEYIGFQYSTLAGGLQPSNTARTHIQLAWDEVTL